MDMIFSKDDLLKFNEMMLGRGMPNQQDGVGYNKADFGSCNKYYNALSNAQFADLAKRLVKYSKTQLGVNKEDMERTAETFEALAGEDDKLNGVSIDIREDGTLISFRYNYNFCNVISRSSSRKFDNETKCWIVPHAKTIEVLEELKKVKANVDNAIEYAMNSDAIQEAIKRREQEVQKYKQISVDISKKKRVDCEVGDNFTVLSFTYNKKIVDKVKELKFCDRQYDPNTHKWSVRNEYFEWLKRGLEQEFQFYIVS
jgi:hypothetical protein